MSKVKGNVPDTSQWGVNQSMSFKSNVLNEETLNLTNINTSRDSLSKQKPQSGNAGPVGADGWRPPTPFRAYVCKLIPGDSFEYKGRNSIGQPIVHFGGSGYNPPQASCSIFLGTQGTGKFPRVSVNQENRTLTECLNKVKQDKANFAESIANLDRTLSMLTSAVVALARAIKAARKGDFYGVATSVVGLSPSKTRNKNVRAWTDGSGNRWLEYQYGWKPLVNDVVVLSELAKEQNRKLLLMTAKRRTSMDEGLPVNTASTIYAYSASGFIRNDCFVRLDYVVSDPKLALIESLGLGNPFLLAWELVPFSFVIDWLLPIGNVLDALTTSLGILYKGGSTTLCTTSRVTMLHGNYFGATGRLITATVSSISVQRKTHPTLPLPRLYIKSPFTSLTRAVTALALLNQLR